MTDIISRMWIGKPYVFMRWIDQLSFLLPFLCMKFLVYIFLDRFNSSHKCLVDNFQTFHPNILNEFSRNQNWIKRQQIIIKYNKISTVNKHSRFSCLPTYTKFWSMYIMYLSNNFVSQGYIVPMTVNIFNGEIQF